MADVGDILHQAALGNIRKFDVTDSDRSFVPTVPAH